MKKEQGKARPVGGRGLNDSRRVAAIVQAHMAGVLAADHDARSVAMERRNRLMREVGDSERQEILFVASSLEQGVLRTSKRLQVIRGKSPLMYITDIR